MEDRLQHVVGLEIGIATAEMHIPAGGEASLFIENDADAPTLPDDGLVTVAALCLSTRGLFGTVDTRDPRVRNAPLYCSPEALLIGYALGCLLQLLKKRLWTLVCRA